MSLYNAAAFEFTTVLIAEDLCNNVDHVVPDSSLSNFMASQLHSIFDDHERIHLMHAYITN